MKSSEVSIRTRSRPASFSFKGQTTKHTTVRLMVSIYIYEIFACKVVYSAADGQ